MKGFDCSNDYREREAGSEEPVKSTQQSNANKRIAQPVFAGVKSYFALPLAA